MHLDGYNPELNDVGLRSARAVVPLLVEWIHPSSAVDVGCGPGNWLAALREAGVTDVQGVDQNDYGDELRIPREMFAVSDLTKPFRATRRFDLVLCLEVAEHLPPSGGRALVDTLTALGPVIVFSAAIPFQGGTDHRNEQWPAYWQQLFAAHDFVAMDCLRPRIWDKEDIAWWYRQNAVLYIQRGHLDTHPPLQTVAQTTPRYPLAIVHPAVYLKHAPDQSATAARPAGTVRRIWRRVLTASRYA